jgi:hypothetical protein
VNRALEQTGYLQTFGKLWKLSFVFIARAYDRVKLKPTFCVLSGLSDWKTARFAGSEFGKLA